MNMGMNMKAGWGKRRWQDLPEGTRRGISIAASIQMALLASALVDLVRRPKSQVRGGRKWAWVPVLFVNFIGPIAYFLFGRRSDAHETDANLRL